MFTTAQIHSKLLVEKDGKEYMVESCSVDDNTDDILWNIYEHDWTNGFDPHKPFFIQSADWYIVVERPTFGEGLHKGLLSRDLLTVALNVNKFKPSELQR